MVNEQPAEDQGGPRTRVDRAERLQVLATEHWSLLATRSLTYGESFSRVGMFLSVLTGAVISLALLAQVDKFDGTFKLAAVLILSVVLFFGVATLGRLTIQGGLQMDCRDESAQAGLSGRASRP